MKLRPREVAGLEVTQLVSNESRTQIQISGILIFHCLVPVITYPTAAHCSIFNLLEVLCTYQSKNMRKHPPWGMVTLQPLLHFSFRILGVHAQVPSVLFKPPGLRLKLQVTIWDPFTLTTIPPAGPLATLSHLCFKNSCNALTVLL